MDRSDLQQLSKEELIDLILRLQHPEKTSRTSSKPPSTDKKEKRENSRPGGAKTGHEPHNRKLSDNPDDFVDHKPTRCDRCGGALGPEAAMELIGEYDEIDIPPIKPHVTRHRRFACSCGLCGASVEGPAPAVSKTTPFSPGIHALAIYFKGFQLMSYERLRGMFQAVLGLSVSEGALMNMFIRSHPAFEVEADKALAVLRQARVVASDETGVRIEGTNSYHWVFHCKDAVVHQPDYTRAGRVVDEMMGGHVPEVWIADRYGAQQNRAARHQTCLAHLDRDAEFAFEHGSDDLPLRFKLWFDRAFELARNITDFAASTRANKKRALEKQLAGLLTTTTWCSLARKLQAKVARARDQLLTFCDYPGEVDPTNNGSERKLRPSVIQRKVTNGYRAMWAAEAEADVRTTIDTARLRGASPFQIILETLVGSAEPGFAARPP
jgi:transposase